MKNKKPSGLRNELTKEIAEFDAKVSVLRQSIDSLSNGPQKRKFLRFVDALERGELASLEEKSPPRAPRSSTEWLAEAEHLKAAARKYRKGGRIDLALECERLAQRAEQKAKLRRSQGQ